LSEALGQQFVPDNRGGAGGLLGMEMTANGQPDGYTLLMMSGSFLRQRRCTSPNGIRSMRSFPVIEFGFTPFVVTVHPTLAAKNMQEFVALVRAKPGALTYASTGVGGITHLATELLLNMIKGKMVHIPYKSTGAAMTDLLSGQVPVIVGSLLPVEPHFQTGKLRALAVTTAKPWYSLPNVPTVAETVPGYDVELWFGAMAPRGTPKPIIDRLNAALNKALEQPDMKKNLEIQGMQAKGGTPQQFGERIRKDYDRWLKVIDAANIKVE